MDMLSPEIMTGLSAAIGTAVVLIVRYCWRLLGSVVKGTPITIDDKIYAAVRDALIDDAEEVDPTE